MPSRLHDNSVVQCYKCSTQQARNLAANKYKEKRNKHVVLSFLYFSNEMNEY